MTNSSTDARKMERQARLDFFGKNFRYLGDLLRQTVALPSQFIDDDLDSKISVTDFSLDSDILFDADLLFIKPFPDDLMEASFKDSSQLQDDRWWPLYDPAALAQISEPLGVEVNLQRYHEYVQVKWEETPLGPSLWNGRNPLEPGVIQYEEDLYEDRHGLSGHFEEWRVKTVFYTGLKSKPHLACPLIEANMPDKRIRRAELLSILHLIKSAMKQAIGTNIMDRPMTYPVAIYSLASRQGRVLHAYFDGEILHIRRSNYLDFMEKNMDNIKLYLRWMMSEPIGDTILKGSTDKDSAQGVLQWSVVQGLYRIFLKACLTRKKPWAKKKPGQMREL